MESPSGIILSAIGPRGAGVPPPVLPALVPPELLVPPLVVPPALGRVLFFGAAAVGELCGVAEGVGVPCPVCPVLPEIDCLPVAELGDPALGGSMGGFPRNAATR